MTDCRGLGVWWVATATILWCTGLAGAGEKHLAFEVVSIRRHTATSGPAQRPTTTPSGFRSIGLPLRAIFQDAYASPNDSGPLRGDLIVGDSNLLQERYDVVAKVDEADLADWQKPEMTQTMLHAMLQAMLAERFKVVVHYESKEVPVYNLVVAKGGPKFKQAETVDADELRRKLDGGGMMGSGGTTVAMGPHGIRYYGISMAILTQTILPHMAGRPVVDKTGLSGYYDLTLPDVKRLSMDPSAPSAETDESIFTALPEALGLRLEPAKGQVDTVVIDHVERPTEN